ncbi:MAG: type II secretion system protein [Albidovulum sp.]|uniref:type II secretion system protein n=1 Tax=Albidovulum sp. TaxID=1872424 RepID=UPI003CAE8294
MRCSRSAGYSLLEVLVAFAIMSIVLATILPGQSRMLRAAARYEEKLMAEDYAISRLERLGLSDQITPGTTQDTYRDWTVITRVETRPGVAEGSDLWWAVVTVERTDGEIIGTAEGVRSAGGPVP